MADTPPEGSTASERPQRRYIRTAGGAAVLAPPIAVAAPGALAARVATLPARADRQVIATAAIVAALAAFLSAMRKRDQEWLQQQLAGVAVRDKVTPDDISAVIADEMQREDAFAEASVKRVTKAAREAWDKPDADARAQAIQSALDREKVYARQHAEAMAARSFAAVGRVAIKADSPQGAYWKLDPHVKEHTAGCLVMGRKFWPWVVLDRVHPPRHAGCPCRLLSFGEAVAEGLMRPGDVPNVSDALRAASGVVMEAADVERLLAELELRDRLVESGMATSEALAAIPLGVC